MEKIILPNNVSFKTAFMFSWPSIIIRYFLTFLAFLVYSLHNFNL
jgi:hypothetical protein